MLSNSWLHQASGSGDVFPSDPVLWLARAMSHGKHPQHFPSDNVRNVVGKHAQIHPPITTRSRAMEFRMGSDPQQAPIHFVFESLPESGPLGLAMANGSQQLELRFLEERDPHGARRSCAWRIASS